MANTYLTSNLIAPRAVAILRSINSFIRLGNRRWENMLIARDYAPGETINLRLDNFYNVQRGQSVVAQDIVEASVPLTMQPLFSVPINYVPTDLQRDIVDFSAEFLEPAVRAISANINAAIYQSAITQIANYTGDISSPLNTFKSVSSINPIMDTLNMNNYGRNLVVDPYNFNEMVSSSDLRNSFLPSLNKSITIDASLGRLAGFEVFKDTTMKPFVSGTHATSTSITVQSAVSSGSTIALTGFSTGATVKAGDIFTIPGVYKWDAINQVPLVNQPVQFVIQADATETGGVIQASVYPSLVATGTRTNFYSGSIPNQIAAGTAVQFVTNTSTGYMNQVAFTDRGLALAMPPLVNFDSPYSFVSTDPESGVSIRVSRQADILAGINVMRVDCQMGVRWINDQCVKVLSNNI